MVPTGFSPDLKNPNYPCDNDRPKAVGEYLASRNFLERDERVRGLTRAHADGRNETWHVETTARKFVVKQFLPWPANGRAPPSPGERFRAECQFYRTARIADGLERALPAVLHSDCRAGCMIFEDVGASSPELELTPTDAETLAWFLVSLHHHSQNVPASARYGNCDVVGWQMAHLFQQSRSRARRAPGRWLARFAARGERVRHALEDARAALAKEGASLVHGDFTAPNWVRTADGSLRVVDAEFSFFGPPEFDAGAFLASLLFAQPAPGVLRAGVKVVTEGCLHYQARLTAAFAVVHLCAMLERSTGAARTLRGASASGCLRRLACALETGSLATIVPGAAV